MIDRIMNATIVALIIAGIIVIILEWARDSRRGR